MSLHSYHVFLFPFRWEPENAGEVDFSKRHDITKIARNSASHWVNLPKPKDPEKQVELYNEQNFFYKFTHTALYDTAKSDHPTIMHFERDEAYHTQLEYEIGVVAGKKSRYKLKLNSIGLDVFSTGTGVLMFYMENHDYPEFDDVRRINQFGRRIFPPFLDKETGSLGTKNAELADFIAIHGLQGDPGRYEENFNRVASDMPWGNARFISSLLEDFSTKIKIEPVVDDRMFTMCWYFNNKMSKNKIAEQQGFEQFVKSDEWHQYLYVDGGTSTCQNDKMQKDLLEKNTYQRWQKWGTLYGMTKYSFMAISEEEGFPKDVALPHFRTIYTRIVELNLVQRASILKFSAEVTHLSSLAEKNKQKLADSIGDFYKSYIRFVNQIFFREVTAQEQGIELYDMLQENMRIKDQVKDLDREIEELHNYASLLDDKAQNRNLGLLTILGSLFLVPSFIVGYFGMNFFGSEDIDLKANLLPWLLFFIAVISGGLFGVVELNKREKHAWRNTGIAILVIIILTLLLFPYLK